MKLVTFESRDGGARPGLVVESGGKPEGVLDLSKAVPNGPQTVLALIAAGESALSAVQGLAGSGKRDGMLSWSDVKLLAPIPRPLKNVFCVGRNYSEHVAEGYRARGQEVKLPEVPQFFTKPPTAVAAPDQPFAHDDTLTTKLDYEVELALVIGKAGSYIPAERAYDHIFGYTIANDITARDLQRRHEQWFKGKGLDGSCPLGPWIVHKSALPDPQRLRIWLEVNGEKRQDSNTEHMIFKIPQIIESLSRGLTLEPGDIIATGTPSGVGYAMDPPQLLKGGDVVTCHVEGIGQLSTPIVAAQRRSAA